jgi:hypothetical protein
MRSFVDHEKDPPMKPENEPPSLETVPDALEQRMAYQAMRPVPSSWKATILASQRPIPTCSATTWITACREFLLPTPWVWASLLAAWVVVVGLDSSAEHAARNGAPLTRRDSGRGDLPLEEWHHQQALISALLEDAPAPERQPIAPPRPRSSLRGPHFGRLGYPSLVPSPV